MMNLPLRAVLCAEEDDMVLIYEEGEPLGLCGLIGDDAQEKANIIVAAVNGEAALKEENARLRAEMLRIANNANVAVADAESLVVLRNMALMALDGGLKRIKEVTE